MRAPLCPTDDDSGVVRCAVAGASAQDAPAAGQATRVRAVLEDDRRAARERRNAAPSAALVESSYTTPLRVLVRRYVREHRRVLRKRAIAGLSAAAMLVAAYVALSVFRGDPTHARASGRDVASLTRASGEPSSAQKPPRDIAEPSLAVAGQAAFSPAPVPTVRPSIDPAGLSPRSRLVRADALLQHPSARAAQQARALLELTLPELPREAHGRAALAEACLRLRDAPCARAAIAGALELRPLRSRYRALARRVERAFAEPER